MNTVVTLTPPPKSPVTLIEGSGWLIGNPSLQIDRKLRLGVPNQFGGWGRQSVTPIPPSWSPVSTEDASNLGGGVGGPSPRIDRELQLKVPSRFEGGGHQLANPNPSTEVAYTHEGCWRPRWKGQGRRLAAPTPPFLSIFFLGLR
ncbi:hypothetical protein CRG98_008375 [Punica granatum]|uniref:Uncharacterized protein n=1 Tax=Punica granatum TaxID=22663 RepID=A0A2I0KS97_PUNGR|nr:hypothetical protein CRG98_008375 [Punica granatum]